MPGITMVMGAIAVVLVVFPAGMSLAASLSPLWIAALGWGSPDDVAYKSAIVAGINLATLVVSLRLAMGTPFEAPLKRIAIQVIWLAVVVVGAFNLIVFGAIDRSEAYRIRGRPAATLAELAAHMPDKYPAADVLIWLRNHAAGALLVANETDLRSAGLATRRIQGIAQLQVQTHGKVVALPAPLAPDRMFVRFAVPGAHRQLWIDALQVRAGATLCAVPISGILLIIGAADAPGCEAAP